MRASNIFKQTASLGKEQAIGLIIDHLTWGEAIPYVSGGNGGSGAGKLSVASDRLKEELEASHFDNDPEITADFDKELLDADNYQYCVQFNDANGGWLQFLLWD